MPTNAPRSPAAKNMSQAGRLIVALLLGAEQILPNLPRETREFAIRVHGQGRPLTSDLPLPLTPLNSSSHDPVRQALKLLRPQDADTPALASRAACTHPPHSPHIHTQSSLARDKWRSAPALRYAEQGGGRSPSMLSNLVLGPSQAGCRVKASPRG